MATQSEARLIPGRVPIGKFQLYYERAGSGPAIVFLHGLGGNHLSWWQQMPFFMRWFDCITVDQRSFGLSPDPDGTFCDAHPSDLGALLDHLKIDKAVLVGQSMGGWTIVGYALEHPERVAAMVMADTPGGIFTPEMDAMMEKIRAGGRGPLEAVAIGSLPTYAKGYFERSREMAYLYDSLLILGARPPAGCDEAARQPSLRSREGARAPEDADSVPRRRRRRAHRARDDSASGEGAAECATGAGAGRGPFGVFRERAGRSISWCSISSARSVTRRGSEIAIARASERTYN